MDTVANHSGNGQATKSPIDKILEARSKQVSADDDATEWAKLFRQLGVVLERATSSQLRGECPFCDGAKFYANRTTGLWDCKNCGESGNPIDFVRLSYQKALEETTNFDRQLLKAKRGLNLSTSKRQGLAWHGGIDRWLLPAMNAKGELLSLQTYDPVTKSKPNKFWLTGLGAHLFGQQFLRAERADKPLWILEGPFDLYAADQQLHHEHYQDRVELLAVPGCTTFNEAWAKAHCQQRTVRLLFDNDDAGQAGAERAAEIIRKAKVGAKVSILRWPDGTDDECDVADFVHRQPEEKLVGFIQQHCQKVVATDSLLFTRGDRIVQRSPEFMNSYIQFGTLADFSGPMGKHKSSIARYLAACGSKGLPMLDDKQTDVPIFSTLYFTSEDSESRVRDSFELHGGDLKKLFVHDIASATDPIDVLDYLEEIESMIKAHGVRLVVLDALNSFCGGDISCDHKARRTLSGRLNSLARRTGACVLGIRNYGRSNEGSGNQKALGAVSLGDVARTVMHANKAKSGQFELEFEKVSDRPPVEEPLKFWVSDLSKGEKGKSHLRKVSFREEQAESLAKSLKNERKK